MSDVAPTSARCTTTAAAREHLCLIGRSEERERYKTSTCLSLVYLLLPANLFIYEPLIDRRRIRQSSREPQTRTAEEDVVVLASRAFRCELTRFSEFNIMICCCSPVIWSETDTGKQRVYVRKRNGTCCTWIECLFKVWRRSRTGSTERSFSLGDPFITCERSSCRVTHGQWWTTNWKSIDSHNWSLATKLHANLMFTHQFQYVTRFATAFIRSFSPYSPHPC